MPKEDTQFKPGQSGNPSGKPKGTISLTAAIRRKFITDPERLDRIAERVIDTLEKEIRDATLKELWARLDGPLATVIDDVSRLSDRELVERAKALLGGDSSEGPVSEEPEEE